MSTPKVLVGSPRYSEEIICGSHDSKDWAERNELYDPEHHVEIKYKLGCRGSLLTWTFNSILAEALNKRDDGEITHLVMQHSDIQAEPGWCNELYKRMTSRGDVVVSAVVPLKDHDRTRTSTAIGVRGFPFDFRRYINTSDRPGLPETFSISDVAEAEDEILLINTGLWIADLSWAGWDSFCFSFKDEIRVNPNTGKRQAWVASEDWQMAAHLDSLGAPYSATWIPLKHIGLDYWSSFELPPVYPTFVPDSGVK